MDEQTVVHAYTSTACLHALHGSCRFFCKFCPAPCECPCHDGSTEPYPGYSAAQEDWLRAELNAAIIDAGIEPGPRRAELLVDIVTAVLHRMAANDQAE